MPVAEALAPLRADPARSAILTDIDGTLAPIAPTPEAAVVPAAAREALRELARDYAVVACVSGRRALEARRMVGVEELSYVGNHGFELLEPGAAEPLIEPAVAERAGWAEALVAALDPGRLEAAGLRVEDKGPIQALHWRGAADQAAAERLAAELEAEARECGLHPHRGRKVLELRPVDDLDKGSAVRRLLATAGVRAALYAGDDRTDLDAFAALRALVAAGGLEHGVCVGIHSEEGPAEIGERCDLLVEGTGGFVELLRALI